MQRAWVVDGRERVCLVIDTVICGSSSSIDGGKEDGIEDHGARECKYLRGI